MTPPHGSRSIVPAPPATRRTGLTVLEVMVAVTALALLAALILPAVQASRRRAAAVGCRNNLRQLGLALHEHEAARGRFPGAPDTGWSPHARLLPWLGARPLADALDFSGPPDLRGDWSAAGGPPGAGAAGVPAPAVLRCPADPETADAANSVSYAANTAATRVAGDGSGFFRAIVNWSRSRYRGYRTTPAGVRDGLSTTAAFSEQLVLGGGRRRLVGELPHRYRPGEEATAYMIAECDALLDAGGPGQVHRGLNWLTVNGGGSEYTHAATPNHRPCFNGTSTTDGLWPADSVHGGVVHTAWADGAVSAVADGVTPALWRAAATPDGGEPIPADAF